MEFGFSPSEKNDTVDDQLMSERRILRFKPTLRPERRGQDGQDEKQLRDPTESDFFTTPSGFGWTAERDVFWPTASRALTGTTGERNDGQN
jgi:hypothetical protein